MRVEREPWGNQGAANGILDKSAAGEKEIGI
jgi:hypothetical protein